MRRGRAPEGTAQQTVPLAVNLQRPTAEGQLRQSEYDDDGFGQPQIRRFAQGNGSGAGETLDGFGRPITIGQDDPRKRQRLANE